MHSYGRDYLALTGALRLQDSTYVAVVANMASRLLCVVPAFRTAPRSCHSLPIFNTTHSKSICAANVVLDASLQRVPDPWSGMEMPAGGAQCPHVIRQLFAQAVVQPVSLQHLVAPQYSTRRGSVASTAEGLAGHRSSQTPTYAATCAAPLR
jgi:hypothetical protein